MADDCANPLLLGWIKEWLDQARERNSKGFTVYKKAYESMKACPLNFDHPKEAQQLHGIGPKLCDRLTDKLRAHCVANGVAMPELPGKASKRKSDDEASETEKPMKKARKTKPYVPTLRSGAYALLLALATLDEDASQGIIKAEVIALAQPHSDSSFTAPSDPTKFYTAWNSMKTLVDKDLVYEQGRPLRKYMLTEEGWEVAKRVKGTTSGSVKDLLTQKDSSSIKVKSKRPEDPNPTSSAQPSAPLPTNNEPVVTIPDLLSDLLSNPERPIHQTKSTIHSSMPTHVMDVDDAITTTTITTPPSIPRFTPIILPPVSYTIRLVLDSREVRTKTDRDYISDQLSKSGLNTITRALPLGDALWIAQLKPEYRHLFSSSPLSSDNDDGTTEIVLPHICERKRLDDLIASIKDGRFHEQKFRLRKSGIRNVVYVIEDFSIGADSSEKYGEAVESAIAGMQVVNGYFVKQTSKLDDTISYLERMTRELEHQYQGRELRVIPTRVLDSQTYLPMLEDLEKKYPGVDQHITFEAFSALSAKSEALTLRDLFLKMLMCIRGVTGEKAIEIQKVWKTPRAFVEAFEACDGVKERGGMVSAKLGGLIPRKRVAKGLSVKIAEIWG